MPRSLEVMRSGHQLRSVCSNVEGYPGEVAIHLCLMASAPPLETLQGQHLMLVRGAPGEVAIHLCPMASAHPQETLTASNVAFPAQVLRVTDLCCTLVLLINLLAVRLSLGQLIV